MPVRGHMQLNEKAAASLSKATKLRIIHQSHGFYRGQGVSPTAGTRTPGAVQGILVYCDDVEVGLFEVQALDTVALATISEANTKNHWHFIKSLLEYADELPYDLASGCQNDREVAGLQQVGSHGGHEVGPQDPRETWQDI